MTDIISPKIDRDITDGERERATCAKKKIEERGADWMCGRRANKQVGGPSKARKKKICVFPHVKNSPNAVFPHLQFTPPNFFVSLTGDKEGRTLGKKKRSEQHLASTESSRACSGVSSSSYFSSSSSSSSSSRQVQEEKESKAAAEEGRKGGRKEGRKEGSRPFRSVFRPAQFFPPLFFPLPPPQLECVYLSLSLCLSLSHHDASV